MSKLSGLRPPVSCILVVDDEEDILAGLRTLFETSFDEVTVLTATSGAAALKLLKAEDVDVILSDYKMPGMDGLEFLKQARDMKPEVPRILITAYPRAAAAVQALEDAAIQNFFSKPFKPQQVIDAVNAALVKRRKWLQDVEAFGRAKPMRHDIDAGA